MICGWRRQVLYCSFSVFFLTDVGNLCSDQVRGEFLSVIMKAMHGSFFFFFFCQFVYPN